MSPSLDRRAILRFAAGSIGISTLSAGVANAGQREPDYGGWLDGVSNYDGATVDLRGQSDVTVEVGVTANGGPYGFGPAAVWVQPGTTVRWKWTGDGRHSVVARDGEFESDLYAAPGTHFTHTFDADGIYRYYCQPHRPLGMKGAIAVGDVPTEPRSSTPTPTPEPVAGRRGEWPSMSPETDWPSRGFDAANTRHLAETTGPREDVRRSGTIEFSPHYDVWSPLLADGKLFVPDYEHGRTFVFDAATGRNVWTDSRGAAAAVSASEGVVYLVSESGDLLCLNASTGRRRWNRSVTDGLPVDVQIAGTRLAVAGEDTLAVLSADTGDLQWRRRPPGQLAGVALTDGRVYASGYTRPSDGLGPFLWVSAIDASGAERWRYRHRTYWPPTRPTVAGGSVYVGNSDYNVHAIDATTGRKRWMTELGSSVTGLAVVPGEGGGTIYAGCKDFFLYALDAGTGTRRWRTRTRGPVSRPAVADGVVYAANTQYVRGIEPDGDVEYDRAVHAFDGRSGERLWTVELVDRSEGISAPVTGIVMPPIVTDGAVYVATNDNRDGEARLHVITGGAGRREGTETPVSTPGAGTSGFTAVGTALAALGAAGLERLRQSDD